VHLLTCVQTDSEYIVIKQYVDQDLQDKMFEHTRMLKERMMITGPVEQDVVTTLKVRDQRKDQTEVILQNGEDMTLVNRPRASRVQKTKRETVDIHDLVHSFDDLFPISGHGLAA
jgi:putative AlgH/UPF0301 family transcriptional regulator